MGHLPTVKKSKSQNHESEQKYKAKTRIIATIPIIAPEIFNFCLKRVLKYLNLKLSIQSLDSYL